MILTGRAKEDFFDWVTDKYIFKGKNYSDLNIYQKGDLAQFIRFSITEIAYVIEWLDSKQLFFWVYRTESGYWANSIEKKAKFDNRNEALTDGILIINCIYNDDK